MLFTSHVTPKGNSSYSYISQANADAMAAQLDANNCSGCSNCADCSNCSDCSNCADCSDCSGEIIQAGRPNGWTCYGWLKNGKLAIHCGCHRNDRAETFESAVTYWSNKPDRAEVLMACHYIAKIARQRGWSV